MQEKTGQTLAVAVPAALQEMMMTLRLLLRNLAVLFLLSIGTSAYAQIDGFPDTAALQRALGLSLGAVRVYTKKHGFSYAGYGQIIYQKYSHTAHWHPTNLHPFPEDLPTGKDQELTLTRGVLFLGYRWSDRVVFNSEIRADRNLLERGYATFPENYEPIDTPSHVSVDLANIDYMMSPALTFRAGIVLLPMGLINEFHTPEEYMGTWPGFGDLYTIPSIWHALGFGIAGRKSVFNYRVYVVNGFNAAKFTEFGWRAGREITGDTISHPAYTFRLDYNPIPNAVLGIDYYNGKSVVSGVPNPANLSIHTTLKDLHGEFRWLGGFARAQYAKGLLSDSTELNAIVGTTDLRGIGKRVVGGYVEGGWNLWWRRKNGTMLMPYMRGEASNPQDALPPASLALGLIKNHFLDFIIWTIGVDYRPIPHLSFRPEYINMHDQNQIFWKEFRLGMSYTF